MKIGSLNLNFILKTNQKQSIHKRSNNSVKSTCKNVTTCSYLNYLKYSLEFFYAVTEFRVDCVQSYFVLVHMAYALCPVELKSSSVCCWNRVASIKDWPFRGSVSCVARVGINLLIPCTSN